MKLLPSWIRDFVDLEVDDSQLADDLSMAGISVEGIDEHDGYSIYEVDITTNRVDAMNHYGVARECAAIYNVDLKSISPKVHASSDANFRIYINAPEQCARYSARIVRGVTIKASPEYISRRLTLLGSRPINNAADATNYALWELGHPTHAFDLDLLEGGKIVVRLAHEGETIKTLDGVERKLTKQDLVIADAVKPVAIAGVMGGFDTMITEKTKNVLIESAWFDPATIRRTARRLGMHTDASHRFERGADCGITPTAANRVAQLIVETAGGQVEGELIDTIGREVERPTLDLHRSEVRRILGQDISEFDTARILKRLGFGVTPGRQHAVAASHGTTAGAGGAHAAVVEEVADFAVQVPTWRLDVDREIDLIEEIARIYGYDKFPNTLPVFTGGAVTLPDETKENELRGRVLALGYEEAMSLAFISHADAEAFAAMEPVEIANPLSEEASVMRTSMMPGMLNMLAHNLNRGVNDVRLFESGKVYEKLGNGTGEYRRLSIGATGSAIEASVHQPARAYNFFDLKGDLETLLSAFQDNSVYFDAHTADYYHPGRSARVVMDGTTIGQFGQIHPRIAAERKLRQDVFVAELDLERLFKHNLRERHYTPIPRYPAVDRDFSFLFDDSVTFERIHQTIETLRIPEMRSFTPVEIFRGGNVPAGKYSVLLRAEFQSAECTLRDDEVQLWATQIVKALEALGGTQRA
jgi:phenylalanyl-tRNA synthetase beta chain